MTEETREERVARRSREEQEAKRKVREGRSQSTKWAGASSGSMSSRASKELAEMEQEAKRRGARSSRSSTTQSRTRRRSLEDAEAKQRARGGGSTLNRRSTHSTTGSRRESEDREAKRRARGGSNRSVPTPGAHSASNSSSDRTSRKSESHRRRSTNGRSSRSPRRSEADREAKRRAREGRQSTPTPGASSARNLGSTPESASVQANNESGAVELQALAVEEMEDERMMKLEKANQKLQKQVENMARGVQTVEAPDNLSIPAGTTMEAQSEDEDEEEPEGKSKNSRIYWIVFLILVLVGGGAGAAVALGGSSDAAPEPGITATDLGVNATTGDPDGPMVSTGAPSDSPSESPTVGFRFEPPKPDDCAAMAEGITVSDQSDLTPRNYTVTLSVVMNNDDSVATLESRLQKGLQEVLIPKLAGCDSINRRRLNIDPFAIGNGRADVTCVATACADSSTIGSCYNCLMILGVDLKDDSINNLDLFGKIGTELDSDTLISDLGVDDLAGELTASGIVAGTPTVPPSAAPSAMPSLECSGQPSSQPTGMPTSKPTVMPVVAPTATPTIAPTTSPPTKQPTPGPTSSPTPSPTPGPTQPPTPSPTPPPTQLPTPGPTSPPTPPPTPPPTVNCPSVQSLFEGLAFQTQNSHTTSIDYSLGCSTYVIPIYALIVGTDGCHTCAGVLLPEQFYDACAYGSNGTPVTFQLENGAAEGQTVYYGYTSEFGESTVLQSCQSLMTYTGPTNTDDYTDDFTDDSIGGSGF